MSEPGTSRGFPRAIKVALLLLITVLLVGCRDRLGHRCAHQNRGGGEAGNRRAGDADRGRSPSKNGALQNEVVLPGNIQAFIDAPIFARASGYLKKWYADIGTRVKAGQVLG